MSLSWISKYRGEIFGIAIITIMLFHFGDDCKDAFSQGLIDPAAHPIFRFIVYTYMKYIGSIGVEVFLFLSGVGLYYSFSKDQRLGNFYRKRVLRILPTYLIIGVLFWGIKDFGLYGYGVGRFFKDFFFVTLFTDYTRTMWFVGLIMFLYVIFPIVYHCIFAPNTEKGQIVSLSVLIAICAAFTVLLSKVNPGLYENVQIAVTRIPIFILGCYMGKHIKNGVVISRNIALKIMLGIMTCQVIFLEIYDGTYLSVPSRYMDSLYSVAVLMGVTLLFHKLREKEVMRKFLRKAGDYSLELCVTHLCLRNLMKLYGLNGYNPIHYFGMIAYAVLLSIALKYLAGCLEKGLDKATGSIHFPNPLRHIHFRKKGHAVSKKISTLLKEHNS